MGKNREKDILMIGCFLLLSLLSCNKNLEKEVINHFQNDSLKLKAAYFLLDNMKEHYTYHSAATDSITKLLLQSDTVISKEKFELMWKNFAQYDRTTKEYDIDILTDKQLVEDINQAFYTWQHAPWKNEVSFQHFCQYILPYRILQENLSIGWRDSLYQEYSSLITKQMDLKKAFSVIHEAVWKKIKKTSVYYPYQLNALEMERINKGDCLQCCIYECYVMRALGIPVTIDCVSCWANYSKTAHSWLALVAEDGTYTYNRYSRKVSKYNPIDASTFKIDSVIENDYPYPTDFKKKAAKVWRITYKLNPTVYNDLHADMETMKFFGIPFYSDVSDIYQLNSSITISAKSDSQYAYLCTYRTAKGWKPICYTTQKDGVYSFNNIGDSVIYLPAIYYKGQLIPIGSPFLSLQDNTIEFTPNLIETRSVVLNRKYPLVGHFMDIWSDMKGARVEGSNTPDFRNHKLFYTLDHTPVFRNVVTIHSGTPCQFVRLQMPPEGIVPLAEVEFWYHNKQIKGTPFAVLTDGIEKCFDDNLFTTIKNQKAGYYIGVDFGKPTLFNRIVFYPKNDGNFVMPHNKYELFYYGQRWISLGCQESSGFDLVYNNVPNNALLLLKNLTAGDEERICTYENNQQIWW